MLAAAKIPTDAVGAVVIRAADGATILAHRPDASMQPASTLKTLTSIVGLERLGPTYRGHTALPSGGDLVSVVGNGALTPPGDLVLLGVGNPACVWVASHPIW